MFYLIGARAAAWLGLLLLFGCLPTDTEKAQLVSVQGRVVNSCNKPLVGRSLTLRPVKRSERNALFAATGTDGRFQFPGVPGYAEYHLRLDLPDGMELRPGQEPEVRLSVGNVAPPSVDFHVRDPGEFRQIRLWVAAQPGTCRTWYGSSFSCLRVRESPDQPWTPLERIDGFQYEPGFEYELLVMRHQNPCPPADAPALTYRLVQLISKRAVPAA